MKIKLQIVLTGLTCVFLLISGILYSCAYQGSDASAVLSTTSPEQWTDEDIIQTEALESDHDGDQSSEDSAKSTIAQNDAGSHTTSESESEQNVIYAHICGAVKKPGVYQLSAGARLVELIELAGGLEDTAAGDYMNQASEVLDGQRIYVPDKEELKELSAKEYQAGEAGADTESKENTLVNINTADEKELMELPGIGQAKADSIISYRNANGAFESTEDLMKIPGIKQGLFSQISFLITVE